MKKLILILAIIGSSAMAQQTATLTDQDGSVWINAKWSATLLSQNGPPTVNRVPLTAAQQFVQGTTDGSGNLSATLTPNNTIDQSGTTWQFTITPNATNGISVIPVTITSTTQNMTTVLSASLVEPRFQASPTAFGYADVEVFPTPNLGAQYYNTTTPTLRQFSLAGWTSVAGGGGGAVASVFGRTGAVVAAANDYNFTQLAGSATIAQLPATTVQAVGTVSANTSLKWVTSNTATNGSLTDSGTAITTAVPITASAFNGSASGLTAFPTGQFANPGIVSAVTSGLINELHFQEASTPVDFSTAQSNPTVVGTVGLTGTLLGGMNACPTGCSGNVAPSGYVLLNPTVNAALTMQLYTCTSQALSAGITGGFFDMPLAGLVSATAPSSGTTQAFGLLLLGAQGNDLTVNVTSVAKYAVAPSTFNNTALYAQSIEGVGGCHLITIVRNTGSMDAVYVDGHLSSGYNFTNTLGTGALTPTTSFALGSAPYATLAAAYKHPYPIYFFNAYNRILSAAEIAANYGAIQKFMDYRGVSSSIIQPTTFSDAGNQIIAGIDSLTYGYAATPVTGWPGYLTTNTGYTPVVTNPYVVINNIATVGYQLKQAVAECPTRGYTSINPNASTTVILFGGTNDLNGTATAVAGLPAVSAQVTYQRMRRLVQCWKGATPQPRIFLMTMISRTGNSTGNGSVTNDSLKNAYNDLLRKDFAGADGLIDIASDPAVGQDGASANTILPTACGGGVCFAGDHVHLVANGQQRLAGMVSSYINWADAKTSITNPTVITAVTYTEVAGDVAISAAPTVAQTITLPTVIGMVGTDRYIFNTTTQVVTIAAASGELINGQSTIVCAANTRCSLVGVLGVYGVTGGDSSAGAHWETR